MTTILEQANASALSGEERYGHLPSPFEGSPQPDLPTLSDIHPTTPDRMRLVRGFYGRLTNALTSVGITRYYLETVADRGSLFNFIGMEDQFSIDLSTDDTTRLVRTTPQHGGGYLKEAFDVCADGRAAYNGTELIVRDGQVFRIPLASYISPDGEKNPEFVIARLRDLTDGLETILASSEYAPHTINNDSAFCIKLS